MLHRRIPPGCACLIGFVLASAVVRPALGHPHIWITAKAEIVFSEGKVIEVRHSWGFDAAYSAYAIQGLGSSDGTLTVDQLRLLAKINTESLGEFGYFTVLRTDDQAQAFLPPRDYAMVLEKGQLTLTYTLPVKVPLLPGPTLSFEFYDPTYFASFTLADDDDAIRLVNPPQSCTTAVSRPKPVLPSQTFSEAFYQALSSQSSFGADFAVKTVIRCR